MQRDTYESTYVTWVICPVRSHLCVTQPEKLRGSRWPVQEGVNPRHHTPATEDDTRMPIVRTEDFTEHYNSPSISSLHPGIEVFPDTVFWHRRASVYCRWAAPRRSSPGVRSRWGMSPAAVVPPAQQRPYPSAPPNPETTPSFGAQPGKTTTDTKSNKLDTIPCCKTKHQWLKI